jgi:tetratricopeptide (TPR) repeat protein
LAQYRQENYSAAIEACAKCLAGDPTNKVWHRAAGAHFIQAMAYAGLGREEEAIAALEKGRDLVNSHPLEFGPSWHDELICRILLEEATQRSPVRRE